MLEEIKREIRANNRRTFSAITGGSLVIAAAVIFALDGYAKSMLSNIPFFDMVLGPFADAPVITWVLGLIGGIILFSEWPRDRN